MSRLAKLVTSVMALAVVAAATPSAAQTQPVSAPTDVSVTIKYSGKGAVDANHKLWVWLFDTPAIGPDSIPIAELSLDKNGGTATFPNVTTKQVYIAVAYDEAGGFGGQAPPPPGSPIALYGVKEATDPPQPVVPGPKGKVTIAFNDAQRMQ